MSAASDWLDKVENDLDAARRLLVPQPDPNIEAASYHVQQAAEKAVKALLTHLGMQYERGRRGHDIGASAAHLPPVHPLAASAQALSSLTPWATAFRYPADDPATAAPLPSASEVEQRLREVETFAATVRADVTPPEPAEANGP